MASDDREYELDFVRYEEVSPSAVPKAAARFLGSREAKREVKAQAREDKRRGRR